MLKVSVLVLFELLRSQFLEGRYRSWRKNSSQPWNMSSLGCIVELNERLPMIGNNIGKEAMDIFAHTVIIDQSNGRMVMLL